MRPQVAIAGQHLHGAVPGDGLNFHHIQVGILKQAGNSFMAQVMEAQVFYLRFGAKLFHVVRNKIFGNTAQAAGNGYA